MPAEGFKSITVSEDLYKKLNTRADKEHRTVPGLIEHLLANSKEVA